METKSRYEVISDLENKKRQLIVERDGLGQVIDSRKREIKALRRNLEDKEEELVAMESQIVQHRATYDELIKSTEQSISRLTEMSSSQKK